VGEFKTRVEQLCCGHTPHNDAQPRQATSGKCLSAPRLRHKSCDSATKAVSS